MRHERSTIREYTPSEPTPANRVKTVAENTAAFRVNVAEPHKPLRKPKGR